MSSSVPRFFTNGHDQEGSVFMWLGSPDGISTIRDWSAEGEADDAYFGYSIATAGDVNGDGYSDIIIGAPRVATYAGAAFAYYGSPASLEEDGRLAQSQQPGGGPFWALGRLGW